MLNLNQFPWSECAVKESRGIYISDSLSGVRKKRGQGKHRFELELTTIEMPTSQARNVIGKIGQYAEKGEMTYIHPRDGYSKGLVPVGGLSLSRAVSVGDTTIYVKSTVGNPWRLMAGDYIILSGDTKVLVVGDDVALSSVEQPVRLNYAVRRAATVNSAVKADGVGWVLISDGEIEYSTAADDNQSVQFTLIAVEKI